MSPLDTLFKSVIAPIANLHLNPVLSFLNPADPTAVCPALKVSQGEDSSTEMIEKRTVLSKTFRLENNQFKCIVSPTIIHYDNNGKMEEINLRIEDIDGKKQVTKAPYKIEIFTDRVGYHLRQPDGTNFTIELTKIDGLSVDNRPLISTVRDCQMFYDGLVRGVSMKVLLTPGRPMIFTRLSIPTAPKVYTWKVTQQGQFEFKSFGGDNNKDSLEILVDKQVIDANSFYYTETWTGRVSRRDKKTRIKKWFTDPVYPVLMDPTATINVIAKSDNGWSWDNGDSFYTTNIFIGTFEQMALRGGFRFQNVGVPAKSIIISATLKVWVLINGFQPIAMKIWGDLAASAVAWANITSLPKNINKTTQSTTWLPVTGAHNSIGVTHQVASIVNYTGWASNHNMRFAALSPVSFGTNRYVDVYYFNGTHRVANVPTLVIVYSPPNPRAGDMNFMGI